MLHLHFAEEHGQRQPKNSSGQLSSERQYVTAEEELCSVFANKSRNQMQMLNFHCIWLSPFQLLFECVFVIL